MLLRSCLFFMLLAILGKCQEDIVNEETQLIKEIFQNELLDNTDDGCDAIRGSIDNCVDCYPCEHEIVQASPSHKEIEIRKGLMCDKQAYLKLCCVPKDATLETVPDMDARSDYSTCGMKQPAGVQIGSRFGIPIEDAIPGEYPWVVALMTKCKNGLPEYRCVGTLINSRAVLTAAHCMIGINRAKCTLSVRAGEHRFDSNEERFEHVEVDVQNYFIHPYFYEPGLHYDVVLLILKDPIEQKPHIKFACLANANMNPDPFENCILAGWGIQATGRRPPRHREAMRSIKMLPYNRELCETQLRTGPFGPKYMLNESLMCAVGINGKYPARGDGGGALICPLKGEPNRYAQYGIVALGRADGLPSLFADVTKVRDWIDQKVAENIKGIIDTYYI